MKHKFCQIGAAALIAGVVTVVTPVFGQTVSETTVSTGNGTISEFSPDSIVVRSESAEAPIHYGYTKSTTVVDDAGNPVDISVVKSGIPVQVYYEGTGEHMIARKIVVRRQVAAPAAVVEHKETTTTTTEAH